MEQRRLGHDGPQASAIGLGCIRLIEEDLNRIEHALPKGSVAGERYTPAMMKIVNG